MSTDPLFTAWRDAAQAAGLASVWSTPFFSQEGQVLGTFAVYSRSRGEPTQGNLDLVARATHLASIAVERHVTEESLRESERRFATSFYASPALMTITRFADGRFLYVNDAFVRMLGYPRSEAIGQTALGLGLYADPAQRPKLMELLAERRLRDVEAKARTKSGRIVDLVVSMCRLELQGEETVLQIALDITDRKRAEAAVAASERLLRVVVDTLPVGVAVVDPAGNIVLHNPASRRIWGGMMLAGAERYSRSKGWWHTTGNRIEEHEWASARTLSSGESVMNDVVDIEAFDGVRKVIHNSSVPIRDAHGAMTGAVIVNEDVSARVAAENELQDSLTQLRVLTTRLMRAQDDERRRIAQLLHDTTAQDLAALKMQLAKLSRTDAPLSASDRAALVESISLADRSMRGIRTMSYLLYPPFLDDNGLLAAIRWYADGFAGRSGIAVDLDLPPSLDRMPQEVETTLFRVVQEGLINVHRHAASSTAGIRLERGPEHVTLEIHDHGRGIAADVLSRLRTGNVARGIGIAGMRERVEQLAGTLDIESTDRGSTIRATVPVAAVQP
jgi:PAS domain S-box-containing protein